jgi:hypothetical protein
VPRSIDSRITPFGLVIVVVTMIFAVAGCVSSTQPAQSQYIRKAPAAAAADPSGTSAKNNQGVNALSNTDPCASRLHDICEPLLLYYLKNHQLPARLEELRELPGFETIELTCPVSRQAYLYNPIGITTAENRARIICYDPTPAHAGCRWAISIIEPEADNGPLVTKVIGLPESHFTFMGR